MLFPQRHDHYIEECKDLKEQIEELIQKGELQNLSKLKRDHHYKIEEKLKQNDDKNEDEQNNARTTVSEIRMINGGLVIRGSFKYLWKTHQRQVNSIHVGQPMIRHWKIGADDMAFSK